MGWGEGHLDDTPGSQQLQAKAGELGLRTRIAAHASKIPLSASQAALARAIEAHGVVDFAPSAGLLNVSCSHRTYTSPHLRAH
jgi:hypothetical protein